MRSVPVALAVLVLAAGQVAAAAAQTLTLEAVADSYVKQGSRNQNQGDETFARIQSSGKNRVLVRIDANEITTTVGAGNLVAATLELFIETPGNNWGSDGRPVDAHRLLQVWTEPGVTWNCADDSDPGNSSADCDVEWDGGALAAAATDSVIHTNGLSGWISFDVTADVAVLLAGAEHHGWLLKLANEGQSGKADYTAREGTAGQAPRLVLEVESAEADATAPDLAITSPTRAWLVADTPEIVVTYADGGSGIDEASLEVRVDGVAAVCSTNANDATCESPELIAGTHSIEASIRDLAGNLAETTFSFEILLGDGPHTISFPAVADTYLRGGSANQSQGAETFLRLRSSGNNRALVRFDHDQIAEVLGTATLIVAGLELTIEDNAGNWGTGGRTVDAHRLISDWSESGATWNCADDADPGNQSADCDPQWDGGSFEPDPTAALLHTSDLVGPVSFDVTADLLASLAGAPVHGWLIKKTEEGQNGRVDYSSRTGTSGQEPRLTVTFAFGDAADVAPPVLRLTAPSQSVVVGDETPRIAFEFSDAGVGVDLTSLEILLDGDDLLPNCSLGSAAATCEPAALAAGPHTVNARLDDLNGNRSTVSFSFELLLGEGPLATSFTAVADTYLKNGSPNQNQGDESFLRVRQSGKNRALVRFDGAQIGAAVGDGTLRSATLELFIEANADNWGSDGRPVGAHRITEAWTENGATWNCPDDTDPGDQSPDCASQWSGGSFEPDATSTVLHTRGLTGQVQFDVTADVAALLAGAEHHGWSIKKVTEGQSGRVEYSSLQGTPGQEPRLMVVFDPPAGPVDEVAPVLAITDPLPEAVIESSTTVISLTYSDVDSGIDAATLEVGVDGFALASSCTFGSSAATCPTPSLTADRHVVTASIRDLAGNATTVEVAFEVLVDVADETPPTLTITSPTATEILDDPTPAITIEYGDAGSGISLVDFELLVEDTPVEDCLVGATTATCEPPPLALGEHTVLARISDLAFNSVETTVTFTLSTSQLERDLPALTITSPTSGAVVSEATPTISVTYSDAGSGVDLSTLRIGVDAFELTPDCVVGPASATCSALPLPAGPHRAWAQLGDLHGNTLLARADFEIVLAGSDSEPPEILVLAPIEGAVSEDPDVQLRVQLADAGTGVDAATVEVLIDGEDLTLECSADAFSVDCLSPSLGQGSHSFEVRVRDLAGNEARETVAFDVDLLAFDVTPPELTIRAPAASVGAELLTAVVVDYTDADTGVDLSTLRITLDGGDLTGCSVGAVTATCPIAQLGLGSHDLAAEISDRNSNPTSVSLTFSVAGEQIPPLLTVLAPVGELVTGTAAPEIVLGYEDALSGVDPATLQVSLDGSDITAGCVVEPQQAICQPPPLISGFHTLTAEIFDQSGNRGSTSFLFEVLLDLEISVASPVSGLLTREATIDVSGVVSPQAETVEVSGVLAELGGGSFVARDVPLHEGSTTLTAVARTAGGGIGLATVTVVRDTEPPRVAIHSPPNGLVTASSEIVVAGELNDPASSAVEMEAASVTVNGLSARVEQRAFLVEAFRLHPGTNRIRVEVVDPAGNTGTAEVTVVSEPEARQRIEEVLGNGQSSRVGETLEDPLVVRMVDAFGTPLAGRRVRFEVVRGSGQVSVFGDEGRALTVRTDRQGLAEAAFVLGSRSGAGSHQVIASSPGFPQSVVFCASAEAGEPQRIVRVAGNDHRGALVGVAGQPYSKPFYTQVFDTEGNPVAGVEVTYEAILGGGHFDGLPSFVAFTDAQGMASARFTLGPEGGVNDNLIEVSFAGLDETPVTFTVSGKIPGPPQDTAVVGVVLDNEDEPVDGVTVSILGSALTAVTAADGRFRLAPAPVGTFILEADGTTTSRPGTWPVLDFELTTVSGRDNDLGMPIRLLPLDDAGGLLVGGAEDVTIPMAGVAGGELTVFAGSTTFPDGSTTGQVSITQVHGDKVPMQAPLGSSFMLAWTVQPPGVRFDPPARIAIPNTAGDPPGKVVDIFSFDHDLGEFVAIGTATVAADGRQLVSNPGSGVVKSGWHGCVPPPAPPGGTCYFSACTRCVGKATESKCHPVCQRCIKTGCKNRDYTKVTIKANDKNEDDKLIVGLEQEVTFKATALMGNMKVTCPDPKYAWDFGDMKMGENKATEKHEYKKAQDYTVKLTVTCESCSTAKVEDTIKIKVIDFTPDGFLQRVDTSSEDKLEVVEEDLDGDGEDDRFFRVLGGVRLRMEAKEPAELAGRIKNYEWSAMDGDFFDGFKSTAMGLNGADLMGAAVKEVFWQGEWMINRDDTVELKVTLDDDDEVIGKMRLRSRELKSGEKGDDGRMLQHLLRMFGVSSKGNPGYAGTAVPVDSMGRFGPQTSKAVRRFKVRDDLPTCVPGASGLGAAYKRCIAAASDVVGDSVLEALKKHWEHFQEAMEAFETQPTIRFNHASFPAWASSTATLLQNTYSLPIHNTVAPGSPYVDLVTAWARKEGAKGQWGRSVPFRIVLGGADDLGSLGFTQIINTHKYGTSNIASIEDLNLYHPEENMNGLAVFSNEPAAVAGGGMHRAFVEANPGRDYTASTAFPWFPAVGASYTDDNKDRLSKGIMAYNRGRGLRAFRITTWPEMLRQNNPPSSATGFGTRTAIKYTLTIQANGGIPLRCWEWTDLVITTGTDEVCDSAASVDPADVAVSPQPIGNPGHKVCIVAGTGDGIQTLPAGNDRAAQFQFDYCEADFIAGRSWDQVWTANLPTRIP